MPFFLAVISEKNVIEVLTILKALRPSLDVIVMGCNLDDASILKIIAAGAKSFVDEVASVDELVRAIRTVRSGSVWAPRRVLSMFVEQAYRSSGTVFLSANAPAPSGRERYSRCWWQAALTRKSPLLLRSRSAR
jgi:DNA-binding NarL/FixJ family response regulator